VGLKLLAECGHVERGEGEESGRDLGAHLGGELRVGEEGGQESRERLVEVDEGGGASGGGRAAVGHQVVVHEPLRGQGQRQVQVARHLQRADLRRGRRRVGTRTRALAEDARRALVGEAGRLGLWLRLLATAAVVEVERVQVVVQI